MWQKNEVPDQGEGAGQVSQVTKHMASHVKENKVPGGGGGGGAGQVSQVTKRMASHMVSQGMAHLISWNLDTFLWLAGI